MTPIYILNYKPLIERRKYLQKEFKKIKLNVRFIIQEENEYKNKPILKRYLPDKEIWDYKFKTINKKNKFHKLSDASINLNLNHYKIWNIINKLNHTHALIIEDDAIIEPNFKQNLNKLISQLEKVNWDVCFIDLLCDNRYRLFKKKGLIANKKGSWGLGGYIIHKNKINLFLKEIYNFTLPMDEEFKFICKKYNLKVYWQNPPLIHQGSIYGPYKTTNQTNLKLKTLFQKRYILYSYLESKRFQKNKRWKIVLFIKDIIQEIEIKLKYFLFKKE
ncbi:MAG: glycosyltransferase family 25 protein [Candidatus ainarchaeum sp.]|nr:glycosyltransferase family 25 protein [Candidatus ainarchaeum sp.]